MPLSPERGYRAAWRTHTAARSKGFDREPSSFRSACSRHHVRARRDRPERHQRIRCDGEAAGSPGAVSHQAQSRKDCVGTARNTGSRIWFTVANGILSDVYAPTVDATNVETMQFLVTDGSSFTDLQERDMTYTASPTRPA